MKIFRNRIFKTYKSKHKEKLFLNFLAESRC
nr:MAG TPA: hypothetical protein [Caudoviricetes sp.]